MKKPLYSLLIVTLIFGIAWILRNPLIHFFFPCENFGCIGSGILYFVSYIGIAAIVYIGVLIYLYRISHNFTKSFSYIFLSLLTLFGIIISDGVIEKRQMGDTMENAYKDCMEALSGKTRESAYCETYRTPPFHTLGSGTSLTESGRENGGTLQTQTEIQGIEMSMNGGLSCPNCIDTIKIHPSFVEYDKATITLDSNRDTRPPAPIHFSGALSEADWMSLVGGLRDEDFLELDTNLPPPDWEGMWLVIEKVGLQKRYIINDGISLGPKLTELFRKIEEIKKGIREQNTVSQSQPQSDNAIGDIQKISMNVGGMFGNTKVEIASGSIDISSTTAEMNRSGDLNEGDWNALTKSISLKEFLALDQKDPRFRCEACAYDGDNMKSITLTYSGGEKTISYGSKNDIKEFRNLDTQITALIEALVGKK